jgi:hypothetical protein
MPSRVIAVLFCNDVKIIRTKVCSNNLDGKKPSISSVNGQYGFPSVFTEISAVFCDPGGSMRSTASRRAMEEAVYGSRGTGAEGRSRDSEHDGADAGAEGKVMDRDVFVSVIRVSKGVDDASTQV